jgi:hypothetical protein
MSAGARSADTELTVPAEAADPVAPEHRGDPWPSTVEVTAHALERWQQRIDEDGATDLPVREAWCTGLRVGRTQEDGANARLHPPTDALLVYRGPEYAPTVVTVYPASGPLRRDELNCQHLARCAGCGLLLDPQRAPLAVNGDRRCPWCPALVADATAVPHLPEDIVERATGSVTAGLPTLTTHE